MIKKRKIEIVGDDAGSTHTDGRFYNFSYSDKLSSAERFASSKPLHCTNLPGYHGDGKSVNAIEFSEDGSFFVSGGKDNTVLLWSTSNAINCKESRPKTIKMNTKHEYTIVFLAMTPDNERIFSGSRDKKVLLHDATT
jgi:WD40 repeat protein